MKLISLQLLVFPLFPYLSFCLNFHLVAHQSSVYECKESVFKNGFLQDFRGEPVVKTPHFQFRGCGFDPWSGNSDPSCCMAWQKKKKKKFFLMASSTFYHPCESDNTQSWEEEIIAATDRLSAEESCLEAWAWYPINMVLQERWTNMAYRNPLYIESWAPKLASKEKRVLLLDKYLLPW